VYFPLLGGSLTFAAGGTGTDGIVGSSGSTALSSSMDLDSSAVFLPLVTLDFHFFVWLSGGHNSSTILSGHLLKR
jgi:hypothetical protein